MRIDGQNSLVSDPTHEVQRLGLTPSESVSRQRGQARGISTCNVAPAAGQPRRITDRENSDSPGGRRDPPGEGSGRPEGGEGRSAAISPGREGADDAVMARLRAAVGDMLRDLSEMGIDPPDTQDAGGVAWARPARWRNIPAAAVDVRL